MTGYSDRLASIMINMVDCTKFVMCGLFLLVAAAALAVALLAESVLTLQRIINKIASK